MSIAPSELELWFTTHPGPLRHSLAATAVEAPGWDLLQAYLPQGERLNWPLGYSEPGGDPELRGLVAASYGKPAAEVTLTQGAVEANWLAMASLVRPGDRVVIQTPIYPQLPCVAAALGAEVIAWRMPDAPEAPVDLASLAELLDPRVRLVVLNSPHNPTGRVLEAETLEWIAARVTELPDAYLLVDEVYRGVGEAPLPPSAASLPRTLVSGSTSKAWALPGLRVGWLVGPQDLIDQALRWREHSALANASPAEAIAKAVWPERARLIADNQAINRRNRALVEAWLAEYPALSGRPSPAAGCFLMSGPGTRDDRELCERWYREDQVMVIPASTIGYPGRLRVGYGQRDAAVLAAALDFVAGRLGVAASV